MVVIAVIGLTLLVMGFLGIAYGIYTCPFPIWIRSIMLGAWSVVGAIFLAKAFEESKHGK